MRLSKRDKKIRRVCLALQEKYYYDPVGFIDSSIDFSGLSYHGLTKQQKEIARSFVKYKRACVAAGGGIGKTAIAAMLVVWGLLCHVDSKIIITGPSGKQLEDALWSEVGKWLRRCKYAGFVNYLSRKMTVGEMNEWRAVLRSPPKDNKEINDSMAGLHAPWIAAFVDEASGVSDQVFTAIEGSMTQDESYILMISNPVSSGGYFYDTLTAEKDENGLRRGYKVYHYSSLDSPLVDKAYEQRIISRYGKNSPMYKAKVLGLPISELESVVVPPDKFDEIVMNNRLYSDGSIVLSVDPSGGGANPAVIMHKKGNSIIEWNEIQYTNPTDLTNRIVSLVKTRYVGEHVTVIVDAVGIGAGVYSNLESLRLFPVVGFIGSESATNDSMFASKRVEGYWRLKEEFEHLHFPVVPPKRLKKELANLKFDFSRDSKGRIDMEPKKQFKSTLGFSPDFADALMMSMMVDAFAVNFISGFIRRSHKNLFNKLTHKSQASKFGKFGRFM